MANRPASALPAASPQFALDLIVEADDVDALGHVSNIVYVRWLQDVATAHANAVAMTHAELLRIGAVFVVRKHEIEYLRPGFLGERITLRTHVSWWKGASCERVTSIERASDSAVLARAKTLWAFVNAQTGKPTRLPPEIVTAFASSLRDSL
jgi:acyl-CoA thioester hydrolase